MHDPGFVGARKAVGDLGREREEAADRKRPFHDELAQRPARDELHRDVRRGLGMADLIDRDDVWMVQRRGGPRFLLEAIEPAGVRRYFGGQHLEREFAAELRVARPIDLAHAAGANGGNYFVRTDAGSG